MCFITISYAIIIPFVLGSLENQVPVCLINGLLYRFTQRNILRVYPKGTRVNSSNYNPLIGWMHGAQMVAFNMQVCVSKSND
jgi:hypothetical protein